MKNKIRVMLVDDHGIVREGLRAILSLHADIEVVCEAIDGRQAIEKMRSCMPDIVIMDISMPGMDGLEATKRLVKAFPETRVLVLSQHDSDQHILSVLKAGASGYVYKRSIGAELVAAIHTVQSGGCYLPPQVAQMVLQHVRVLSSDDEEDTGPLTEREREVLKLVVEGYTNQQIADLLCLSKRTVMCHRANIASKLGIHNRAGLFNYALRMGIVQPV